MKNVFLKILIGIVVGIVVFIITTGNIPVLFQKLFYITNNNDKDQTPYITFMAEKAQVLELDTPFHLNLSYSLNNEEWKEFKNRESITFGGKYGNIKLRGKNPNGTANDRFYSTIIFRNNVNVSCIGDIRTLIDYENYQTVKTDKVSFHRLFYECYQLVSAPDLPLIDLAEHCYSGMFEGCSSLKEAPRLPAIKLSKGCYSGMFRGCSSLEIAPELPASNIAENCYFGMFWECYSLKRMPKLPAYQLESYCYFSMFAYCTSLSSVSELPSTSLADYCYDGMFQGCSSLKEAPRLPAEKLSKGCYSTMFRGCSSLCKIDMQAIDISAEGSLLKWVYSVADSGTFIKNKNAKWDEKGVVPNNWIIRTE